MTLRDLFAAWWRKTVAAAVGAVLTWLAVRASWLGLDPETQSGVTLVVATGIISAYGGLVNALERKWPKLGWLLGLAIQPKYRNATGADTPDLTRRAGDYR